MVAWLRARSCGGRVVMRMEDLDHPKDKPGADKAAIEDLRWLGFDWDDEFVQSSRKPLYREVLARLVEKGLAYPCVCSRRDVESAQSAPHAGEQLHYPGTCRGRFATWSEAMAFAGRTPCWRFRVDKVSKVAFDDMFAGRFEQDVAAALGDFPLARDEGGAGYTLAVVVDDAAMGVTEVVRGDDLLAATPAQILVQRALGLPTPRYCHLPLVVGPDGRRLAKRHGDTRVSSYREAGIPARRILGYLASSCGWAERGEELSLDEILPRFRLDTIPHSPLVVATSRI
jgi:glutamyl-tRNA synthetase